MSSSTQYQDEHEKLGAGSYGVVYADVKDKNRVVKKIIQNDDIDFAAFGEILMSHIVSSSSRDERKAHVAEILGFEYNDSTYLFSFSRCSINLFQYCNIMKKLQIEYSGCEERFVKELMKGINYIHSRNVYHGDIQENNVMLKSNLPLPAFGDDNVNRNAAAFIEFLREAEIVIIDFGISTTLTAPSEHHNLSDPPEMCFNTYNTGFYIETDPEKTDNFAAGAMMCMIANAEDPFDNKYTLPHIYLQVCKVCGIEAVESATPAYLYNEICKYSNIFVERIINSSINGKARRNIVRIVKKYMHFDIDKRISKQYADMYRPKFAGSIESTAELIFNTIENKVKIDDIPLVISSLIIAGILHNKDVINDYQLFKKCGINTNAAINRAAMINTLKVLIDKKIELF